MCDCITNTTVKWKPLELGDLLRLLQPVESSWKELADLLLKNKLQYKINTIESDAFHDNTSERALGDVLRKWLQSTPQSKRNWQTLSNAAKKYEDDSLEKYIEANCLESEFS